jgi:hypothetical protein
LAPVQALPHPRITTRSARECHRFARLKTRPSWLFVRDCAYSCKERSGNPINANSSVSSFFVIDESTECRIPSKSAKAVSICDCRIPLFNNISKYSNRMGKSVFFLSFILSALRFQMLSLVNGIERTGSPAPFNWMIQDNRTGAGMISMFAVHRKRGIS